MIIHPQHPMVGVLIFIYGLMIGSFLNVCIYRLPRGASMIHPGSNCPACGKPIAWYDNIPLLSYLFLAAKCRHCKHKISPRYFWIELATGILWLGFWFLYGISAKFFAGISLTSILFAISITDFETQIIPDALVLPGALIGFAISLLFPELHHQSAWFKGLGHSVLGFGVGGLVIYTVGLLGNLVFKKESMGGGDVKLLAMIGAYVGFPQILFVFFFSPFVGLPFAIYTQMAGKSKVIPFGPFLAISGLCFFVAGDKMIHFLLYR